MRFVCDSCRAQYMISDDKVGAKGVKVRCKKCGHLILVRKQEAGAETSAEDSSRGAGTPQGGPSSDDAMPTSEVAAARGAAAPQADALLGDVEDDEIGAVFDQVLKKTGAHPAATAASPDEGDSSLDEQDSTRVVNMDTLRRMAEDAAESKERPGGDSGKADAGGVPTTDWYVAVREEQVGPLTLDRVKELWDRGEVGAESLCWRAGFPDWVPLSEVKDLKAVLAPRPAKPVIVAPAAVTAPSPAPGPVESAFTAGSSSYTPPRGSPAQAASPSPSDTGAWTPSAASALASLAQQEVESFSKPAPRPAAPPPPEPMAMGGLLDLPPPEPAPVMAPQPRNTFSQLPALDEPEPPRARAASNGYSSASAPYPQATYDAYRPPAPAPPPPAPSGGNKNIVVAVVGAIALAAIVGLTVAVFKPGAPAVQQEPIARAQPPVQPVAQPAVAPAPPPVVAQVQPAPVPPPAAQQVAPAPVQPTPAPVQPVAQAPAPVQQAPVQPAPAPSTEVAKADSASKPDRSDTKRPGKHTERVSDRSSSRSETVASNDPPPPPKRSSASSAASSDDDFDKEFGDTKSKTSKPSGDSGPKARSYIPPAPGSGDVQERLGNGDIMQVVRAHIPELKTCTQEQKRKNPSLSGTLQMRWTIMPSGKTTSVQVRSDEFKSTYIAGCISGLVKSWAFPKHRVQGDPIDFPFNF